MRRNHTKVYGVAWFIFVFTMMSGMFAASFYLTAYIYTVIPLHPPAVLVQVVNALLGLLFTGIIGGSAAKIANSHGWLPERNVFNPIVEALEKIAKGDFSVRLDSANPDNQMMGVLANSVNKMALELEQMETLRQEFISNVSHEIQSPLTSIGGFAQALQNDQLGVEERHHYLAIIETESRRVSRITEDLLRLAALESEHAKFEPKPYRLDKQVRSLILACEPQWVEKGLEFNAALDEVEITADEDLLSQVWTNLIHNSIKFTPQGGKVWVDLRREGDAVEFKIRDSGIGIAAEDRARIFERFYKADRSRTRSNGGSGLGLAIAKKIVELHGGEIGVESDPGTGTTFSVKLREDIHRRDAEEEEKKKRI
jgi:two-component system, OmpR family, phosphate regulon sensor histidine kinase PhoR